MRTAAAVAVAATLAMLASGCAPRPSDRSPAALAERITRAVEADDPDATTADFDDAAKRAFSRGDLGALSDRMHALGAFASLTPRAADPDAGRYEYDAHFARGAMLVRLRIDPDGKVGAYRVTPERPG